jgi:hypothetical protein
LIFKTSDSRLLWHTYALNRPPNEKCHYREDRYCNAYLPSYNGICIDLRKIDVLYNTIKLAVQQDICDSILFAPIFYTLE